MISYELADGLVLWGGEDKAPFIREELTSSSKQLAVDRSYVNEIFTLDKAQGIGMKWKGDQLAAHVMFNDGYRSGDGSTRQNSFTQSGDSQVPVDDVGEPFLDDDDNIISDSRSSVSKDFNDDQTDFAITARLDFKISGSWGQMSDFVAWEGEEMAAFIGAAVHYEVGETGDSAFNNNFFTWTVDGSLEMNGLDLYAAVIGFHSDLEHEDRVLGPDVDLYGLVVQGSYMVISDKLEPFVRWEYVDFDDVMGKDFDEAHLITAGFNYYMHKHAAKFTLDVVYAADSLPIREEGLGIQVDDPHSDDQIVVRAQMQILF